MRDKLLTALVVSALVHVILIVNLKFINSNFSESNINAELNIPNLSTSVLQVGFLALGKTTTLPAQNKLELVGQDKSKKYEYSQFEHNKKVLLEHEITEQALPLNNAPENITNTSAKFANKQYYKPSEVDISAIPMHGIELPRTTSAIKLLEIYKLRVFINRNGTVDHVVNLNKDVVSQLFYTQVEEQVKNLTFIPAKKNGVEIDSYIDIALEE